MGRFKIYQFPFWITDGDTDCRFTIKGNYFLIRSKFHRFIIPNWDTNLDPRYGQIWVDMGRWMGMGIFKNVGHVYTLLLCVCVV